MKHVHTLLLSLALLASPATAQQADHLPGELIVMLAHGALATDVCADLRTVHGAATDLRVVKELSKPMRAWLLAFDPALIDETSMLHAVQSHAGIALAQFNHVVHDRVVPNDTQYGSQWQHDNIDSEAAWDITTGGLTATGDTIVVCVVENADLPHPDLIGNAWFNHQETPGNGIDDDGNGYIDDHRGWNPGNNDDDVYGGGHGTSVAGMIGAKGNNSLGVAGANWNVKIMVVTRDGISESAVVESYTYPWTMRRLYNQSGGGYGAFVVATNSSWGIDNADPTDYPIWCAMYDSLGADGILSCGATANNDVNIDVVGDMPTGCESDYMISVTATNTADMRTFSGYGLTTIDVGAPGANIFTTTMPGSYGSTSGTSFASPLTAGVIGLLYSAPCATFMDLVYSDPAAGAMYVREALFSGVEQVGNLPGNCVTGGRINSNNSLQWMLDDCGPCPGAYDMAADDPLIGTSILSWQSSGNGPFNIRYQADGDTSWTVLTGVTSPYYLAGLDTCMGYTFQVETECDTLSSGWSAPVAWTTEGCCAAPENLTTGYVGDDAGNVTWGAVLAAVQYEVRISVLGSGSWFTYTTTNDYYEFTGLQPCTDYEVQVRTECGGTPTPWSASVELHTTGCGACLDNIYCESISDDSDFEWIQRVQLLTLDNTSGNDGGYGDYTGISTPLSMGLTHSITLTPGYGTGGPYNENFSVYIDLDGDGDLGGAGEEVYVSPAVTAAVTGTFTVPATATPGITRMRVIMVYDVAAGGGCEDAYDFGETEDYCVELVDNVGVPEGAAYVFSVHAYPDPASDVLTVAMNGGSGGATFRMVDAAGRVAMTVALNDAIVNVDVSRLAAGTYGWTVGGTGPERSHGRITIVR